MAQQRMQNPADMLKYYVDLINAERDIIENSLAAIADYAEKLQHITEDSRQRLLSR